MTSSLKLIQGGCAKAKLEEKLVKEAIRVCVDRDSTGNLDAMVTKLQKMNATNKPTLGLVVATHSITPGETGH